MTLNKIGLQLHSVRGEMERDFRGTLRKVAAIGYMEVEFAGYFGQSIPAIKEILIECGLTAPATHISLDTLENDRKKAIDEALALGINYLVLSGLPPARHSTIDDFRRRAEMFNTMGREIGRLGVRFCYHNHEFEFRKIDNAVPYEVLLNETDPALVTFELDVYWAAFAGRDPVTLFTQYPNRIALLHLKDMDDGPDRRSTEVGSGIIDMKPILSHPSSGATHFFVEQEHFRQTSLQSAEMSFEYLRGFVNAVTL